MFEVGAASTARRPALSDARSPGGGRPRGVLAVIAVAGLVLAACGAGKRRSRHARDRAGGIVAVTLLLAFGKSAIIGWLRRSARHVNRVAGAVLVVAGLYIVWFWVANLNDPFAASEPVVFVETVSSWATDLIGTRPWLSAEVLVVVVILAASVLLAGGARDTSPGRHAR